MQRANTHEVQPHIVYCDDVDQRDAIDGLDRVLGFLSTADFLTPSYALLRGGQSLAIYREDAAEAAVLLRQAGIASWGWMIDGRYMLLNVADRDTYRACKLLGLRPPAKLVSSWWGRIWWLFALLSGLGLAAAMFLAVTGGVR